MKKLMTILVLFAMCGAVMADVTGPDLQTGHYKYEKGVYTLLTDANDYSNNLTMDYTKMGDHVGKGYFSTMSASALNAYNDANGTNYNKVVVQFLGTDIDDTHPSLSWWEDLKTDITDFGIYLYNGKGASKTDITKLMSISEGNSFALDPGTEFGVYYKAQGREWYSSVNYVGTWDPDKHYINYYDENGVYHEHEEVDIRYTCAFMGTVFGDHWEFMLQTTLDKPHYEVNPQEFEGNGTVEIPSGQPLPGTLATLLIGGLCAKTLSKKNKKH